MYLAAPNRCLTARDPSSWRSRRPMLHFAPLRTQVEEVKLITSPVPTSPSSVTSASAATSPPRPEVRAKVPSTLHTPSKACHVPSIAGAHHNKLRQRSPSLSVSDDLVSSSEGSERRVTLPTVHPLSEDEVKHVEASYKKYMASIERPGSLLAFLQELTGSNGVAEGARWQKQLDLFLGTSSDDAVGSSSDVNVEVEGKFGRHPRVLSQEEAIGFSAWLKSTQGVRFEPPSPKRASFVNTETKIISDVPEEGGGSHNAEKNSTSCSPLPLAKAGEVWAIERSSTSMSRGGRSSRARRSKRRAESESTLTSARGYRLERRAFAELGGGIDGGGTIRLAELKRLLRACSFFVDVEAVVGRVIDLERTGRITFKEFLWVLECSVSGKVPASAIRRFLAVPTAAGGSSAGTPTPRPQSGRQPSPTTKWLRGRSKTQVVLPPLQRGQSRRGRALTKGKSRAGTKATLNRRLLEELKQISSLNLLRLSPYSGSWEPELLLASHARPKKQRRRKTHSTRSMSTSPRSPSPRAKSAGVLSPRRITFGSRPQDEHHRTTTTEFQVLRDRQLQLTKRLDVLTGLPVSPRNFQQRQEELLGVQKELNSVLGQITTALRDMSV
ncbi:uncharacterized protein Tco025E_03088 [Trypanosoma conorhini]|uniref:EF-hand domain-containing protein n=1 Tax=Trypanosoma conorhini TaxID=83891 RepID=A0A3R7NIS8_9TRYP|nr:uncharacterized protein Tco025E_03088 [Trypanosoma conorhini]RNF22695.1 hypothetical protein Tco025E_03088 [Trypanosoma conorhini]